MKKSLFIALVLLIVGGLSFAQEGEMIIRGAAGIMFFQSLAGDTSISLGSFRGGVHGDIMYNLGQFEVGGELGFYMMELEYWYGWYYSYYLMAIEIPINAIFRVNFDRSRMFALEARGGLWISMLTDGYFSLTDLDANIGARAVLGVFYIGADYLFGLNLHYPCLAFEAGVKIAFE